MKGLIVSSLIFIVNLSFGLLEQPSLRVSCPTDSERMARILDQNIIPRDCKTQLLEMPALGRMAGLGSLYDARDDRFLAISLLKNLPPDAAKNYREKPDIIKEFIYDDTYSEKFHKLGIAGGLKLTVMTGIEIEGAAEYLNSNKDSAKTERVSLFYSFLTGFESLLIQSKHLDNILDDLKFLEHVEATHYVARIQWGGNVVITAEDTVKDNEDHTDVAGFLSASIGTVAVKVSGEGNFSFDSDDVERSKSFSFSINGDVSLDYVPQTVEEAADLVRRIPALIKDTNGGKGVPIQYVLLPLSGLKSELNKQLVVNDLINELEESTIDTFVDIFDKLEKSRQKIMDLYRDVKRWKCCLINDEQEYVISLKQNFISFVLKFKSDLYNSLTQFRSNKDAAMSDLQKYIGAYKASDFNHEKLEELLEALKYVGDKVERMDHLTDAGVIFVGVDDSFDEILLKNRNNEIRVFYINTWTKENDAIFFEKVNKLLEILEKRVDKEEVKYYVVINDVRPELNPSKKIKLSKYVSGELKDDDLFDEDGHDLHHRYMVLLNKEFSELVDLLSGVSKTISLRLTETMEVISSYQQMVYGFETTFETMDGSNKNKCKNVLCTNIKRIFDDNPEWEMCAQYCSSGKLGVTRLNDRIYTFSSTGELVEFETDSNSTSLLAEYSERFHTPTMATDGKNKIYIYDSESRDPLFIVYDLEKQEFAKLLKPTRMGASLLMIHDNICLAGGEKLDAQDIETDTIDCLGGVQWAEIVTTLNEERKYAVAIEDSRTKFLVGGLITSKENWSGVSSIESYDKNLDAFKLAKTKLISEGINFYRTGTIIKIID